MPANIKHLNGYAEDGTRIASVCFGITLFANPPITQYADGILKAFSRYSEIVGDEALRVYATDTMHQHKPVTDRALSLLNTWLESNATTRETIGIEYSDADPYYEAPSQRFFVAGDEVPEASEVWPSMLRITLDPVWGIERYEEAVQFVINLTNWIPVSSGYVGFAFEYSSYYSEEGAEHAWRYSMQHPGLEIHVPDGSERLAVLKDAIRTVSWLTLINETFVLELGGREVLEADLPKSIKLVDFNGGVLMRVGERPEVGEVNRNEPLPGYRAVYRSLRPLTNEAVKRTTWLDVADNEEDRTERWLRRWDNA
jgi:hypothetical protein